MFRHKIVRADGTTEVFGIKEGSFHFHEQLDTEGDIKVGNVIAGYLEFDFYLSANSTNIPEGEELTYYQVKDFGKSFEEISTVREIQIGKFTVYSSEPKKTTCHIVAYDNIAKLSIDYSARMKMLESSFPMKIIDLLDDAATYAGVTSSVGHSSLVTLVSNAELSAFYSDSITVRDVFSYVGTILGTNIKANPNGSIGVSQYSIKSGDINWYESDYYIICPTDQQTYIHPLYSQTELVPVFYKQDGLEETDFTIVPFDSVKVYKSDGTLFGSYSPDGTENNPYLVSGNLFVDFISSGATQTLINRMCEYIYANLRNAQIHTPLRVSLFPFRCPYRVGSITYFYDTSGNIVKIPIMSMDWSDSDVVIEVFGKETTNDSFSQYSTADDRTTVLSALINKALEGLDSKVSKSGDTMTGSLFLDGKDLPSVGSFRTLRIYGNKKSKPSEIPAVTSNSPYGSISMYDVDGKRIFYNECVLNSSNRVYASYVVSRPMDDNTTATNGFYIGVNANGSSSVTFSGGGRDAWLEGLGLTVESTSTISDILNVGTDVSVSVANFYKFGRVAQLQLQLTRSTDVTSSTAITTLCTLKSGYRPIANAPATAATHPSNTAFINANGQVRYSGKITANNTLYIYATYILA